jgi:hypothetical protein
MPAAGRRPAGRTGDVRPGHHAYQIAAVDDWQPPDLVLRHGAQDLSRVVVVADGHRLSLGGKLARLRGGWLLALVGRARLENTRMAMPAPVALRMPLENQLSG